ncbi:MAG: uracil-DNA glycosylase [Rhodospirillaceae bacterium]|nr:uracil-DNA glycosylase [Rhodospirillaceae bacterium]
MSPQADAQQALAGPAKDCALCPRLVKFRKTNQAEYPEFFNGAVPPFGAADASVLVVGLAPGLKGANRTGRPFTGDYAGDLLYATLLKMGLARGTYRAEPGDITLTGVRITNAVRCVPPENKPTPAEQNTCRKFLIDEMGALPKLRAILSLGLISHNAVLTTLELRKASYPFAHGALHQLPNGILLADSYHCSRYNVNTGRLTAAMFEKVIVDIKAAIKA